MLAKLIEETTKAIVAAVKGVDNVVDAVRETVRDQLKGAMKDLGDVTTQGVESIQGVVTGALKSLSLVGGNLVDVSAGTIRGVVRGVADTGGDVVTAIRQAASSLVQEADTLGQDLGSVAVGAVRGANKAALRARCYVTQAVISVGIFASNTPPWLGEGGGKSVMDVLLFTTDPPLDTLLKNT